MEEAAQGLGDRWEVGSGFAWSEDLLQPRARAPLPAERALFSSARGALRSLAPLLGAQGKPRLHLPAYFHAEVAEGLRSHFEVAWYHDLPTLPTADIGSVRPRRGDTVLVVDYFGARGSGAWRGHVPEGVVVVEDRTHDPFATWTGGELPDFAVASLRKTLPLPDGSLLWSPRGRALPQPTAADPAAAAMRLEAMVLKQAYLEGAPVPKEAYRTLETRAERALEDVAGAAAASAFTQAVLPVLPVEAWRARRTANVRQLLRLVSEVPHAPWRALFEDWPPHAAPLNAVLLCDAPATRDRLEQALIADRIYPAVHWRFPASGSPARDAEAETIAARILTLPCDQRYGPKDLERVALSLHAFARGKVR